jgi:uncharacterized protein YbbK (DUF523 family)
VPSRIIMSACLVGVRSRYDGASQPHRDLEALRAVAVIIPVCPEILGGLGIPRSRCHFSGGDGRDVLLGKARVIDEEGLDRTDHFLRGAVETVRIVELTDPDLIIFKERSPSCGVRIVDIEGRRQPGCGVTTARLLAAGIPIVSEMDTWNLSSREPC